MPDMYGPVSNPMQMGPIRPPAAPMSPVAPAGAGSAPTINENDPEFKKRVYEQMIKDAQKYAGSDPNSMVCPACGGSGVKQGKQA